MDLCQGLDPRGHAGGYLSLANGPSPHKAIIAFERFSETALRPSQRGQASPEAFGCHGHKSLVMATAAPVSAAPAARNAMPTCQTESS